MSEIKKIPVGAITGGIISSVVPSLDYTVDKMCAVYLGIEPMHVAPGLKSGLNIRCDDAREVGADRLVNCVSAIVWTAYCGNCTGQRKICCRKRKWRRSSALLEQYGPTLIKKAEKVCMTFA